MRKQLSPRDNRFSNQVKQNRTIGMVSLKYLTIVDIIRQMRSNLEAEDYVRRNITQVQDWDESQYEKKLISREIQQRKVEEAKERKESQERDKMKMKYFLVHKWEFIREKKQMFMLQCQELQRKRNYKRVWMEYILLKQVMKQVYGTFDEQRRLEIKQRMKVYCSKYTQRVYKKYITTLGRNIRSRTYHKLG